MNQREVGAGPVRNVTDWDLIHDAQAGRLDAFDALIRRYEKPVVSFCMRMTGSREDAEELAQEAFVRVYKHLNRIEPRAKFSTLLFGIARNLALNHIRNRKRRGRDMAQSLTTEQGADMAMPDNTQRPDRAASVTELRTLIEKGLERLSPDHREVIVLREMQGLDYSEIGKIVGCRPGTVKSRIARAREQLRLRIIELGGEVL